MSVFSERLLELRQKLNMTQEEASQKSGIGYRSYRRYESGEREPTMSALIKLADFYGVSIDYLVGRTGGE